MGRAVVERLVREGASVVIGDLDAQAANETAEQITATAQGRAVAVAGDVARRDDVHAMVQAAVQSFGRLDVMVAHAGVAHWAPFLDHDQSMFESTLAVNLTGAFLCIQEAARFMRDDSGSIVVPGSTHDSWTESWMPAYTA